MWRLNPSRSSSGRIRWIGGVTKCLSTRAADWSVNLDSGIVSRKGEALFQTVIGMEIHAQLSIPTKLFSSAPQRSEGARPNTSVWPLDVAVPGFLPRLSQEAIHAAIRTAAACQCIIPQVSRFERKHYAYADLPLGYQVTQQRWPLAKHGRLTCRRKVDPKDKKNYKNKTNDEKFFSVGVDRIQLEQDSGKTISVVKRKMDANGNDQYVTESLVDFNRAGCALIEIVFGPDIRSANDASSCVNTLRNIMRHIGTCDGKMEEGSLRCDLNVSIAPFLKPNGQEFQVVDLENPFFDALPPGTGYRVEVKNLNSMRQVVQAAEYEAIRQAQAYTDGSPTERETRTFDVRTGRTVTIRTKGDAVDYRFMPEPDLPPIVLNPETLNYPSLSDFLASTLPELPEQAVTRLMQDYNLPEDVAMVITGDLPAIAMYEAAVAKARSELVGSAKPHAKLEGMVANWLCNDVFALVKESSTSATNTLDDHAPSVQSSPISGEQLGELVAMMLEGTITSTMGKKILSTIYHEKQTLSPRTIAEERGWKVLTDPVALQTLCEQVVFDPIYATELQRYQMGGKHVGKMEKFFVGKAMVASQGNAHPERLMETLQEVLQNANVK